MKHNENLKLVAEEHEQLKIAFAEQSQRLVLCSIKVAEHSFASALAVF